MVADDSEAVDEVGEGGGTDVASGEAFCGFTGPGRRSTLCFLGVAVDTGCGISFADGCEVVVDRLAMHRTPALGRYTVTAPERRHDSPSGAREDKCICRGLYRAAETA